MAVAIFPYPGGKSRLAEWIVDHIPDHTCYVEVFGGSAATIFNKPTSEVEVYNDVDGDLVQFFEVLRDRPDELKRWLQNTPFARDLYDKWSESFYQGYRPKDPVERAGQFFYLRYAQWGGKYDKPAGLSVSTLRNRAADYASKIENLESFADRFEQVVIENEDWSDLIERYDSDDTVFYFDPPYMGSEEYYRSSEFDHEAFVARIGRLEADWLVSYTDLPDALWDYTVRHKSSSFHVGSGLEGEDKATVERLVMNFDPDTRETFVNAHQQALGAFTMEPGGDAE